MNEANVTQPKLTNDSISTRGTFTNDLANPIPESRWMPTSYSKNGTDGMMMAKDNSKSK